MSHPNRSKKNPSQARNPTPSEIVELRLTVGLTPAEAAKRVHAAPGAWVQWEAGERPMHPVFWHLFRIAASTKSLGDVSCELVDPDDPRIYRAFEVKTNRQLGVIAGPYDERWACFYVTDVGDPRPPGLGGSYDHDTLEKALAAFQQVVD